MRRPAKLSEPRLVRLGAALTGVVLTASAVIAGDLATAHMQAVGAICGASLAPHCGWCFGAASLSLAGLAAFAYAARPETRTARVGARRQRK